MKQNEKNNASYRVLMFITTPKRADRAAKLFADEKLPIHYSLMASGTAPSETLDILGLGTPDRSVLVSVLTTNLADRMIRKTHNELEFNIPGNGIGFTIPMSGANNHILKMLGQIEAQRPELSERKDDGSMSEVKRVLIAAVVNQGYSEEVMNAARAAGAGGGTVIHGRYAGEESAAALWGLGLQEEKEVILIIADAESKVSIMQAISDECGIQSEAKGLLVSLPLDAVVGLKTEL